jgi:hypothetical protein
MKNILSGSALLLKHDFVDWDQVTYRSERRVKLNIADSADASLLMLQAGFSDYSEQNILNYITGSLAMPALPSVYIALFTSPPTSDSGAGYVEVSGTGYLRVQVAGTLTTNGTTSSSSSLLHFSGAPPAWIVPGMTIRDVTTAASITAGTTVTTVGGSAGASTITMSANAAGGGVGNGDTLTFSAFSPATPSVGAEPSTTAGQTINGTATITFAQAGGTAVAGWGTVNSFGLLDGSAANSGNLLLWDYLGNFKWQPFTATASGTATITCTAHGFGTGDPVVFTTKYGGTLPGVSSGTFGGVNNVTVATADTFTVPVGTSTTGDGQVRKISQQSIPANVIASFSAGQMTLSLA